MSKLIHTDLNLALTSNKPFNKAFNKPANKAFVRLGLAISAPLLFNLTACDLSTLIPGEPDPDPVTDAGVDVDVDTDAGTIEPTGILANIYPTNPLDGLEEVVLVEPTSDDGSLTSAYVDAINCTDKEGGVDLFGFGNMCLEEKTAFPNEDGNYTDIAPPPEESGSDVFAELQMYHHVNLVHDYFKGTHGFTGLDFPLNAVVNLTINFGGTWQSFPNAAFMPEETITAFGLPPRDFGAIMFGQGDDIDFSYDASVIYHEYVHAVNGVGRFQGTFMDQYGLNNSPGALGEAVADYFASTILGNGDLGIYALGSQFRDLTATRTCPENMTTQIHADGKIVGTAMWAARAEIGAELVDKVVFGAVMASLETTGMEQFGQLMIDESQTLLDADQQAAFEQIMLDHGVVGCDRVREWDNINFAFGEGVPHQVEGSQNSNAPNGIPGYHGWKLDVPDGQIARLSWTMGSGGGGPFGGGGEPSPLSLALKKGSPVLMNTFTGDFSADAIIDAPEVTAGNVQTVQLSGDCLPVGGGTVYLMFRNTGADGSPVIQMSVGLYDDVTQDLPIATCD